MYIGLDYSRNILVFACFDYDNKFEFNKMWNLDNFTLSNFNSKAKLKVGNLINDLYVRNFKYYDSTIHVDAMDVYKLLFKEIGL